MGNEGTINRLVDLRKDLDMSQVEIAKNLGYHTTTYARWEHNPMQMKLQDLINLAKYHNVSLDYIAGLTNDKRGIGYKKTSDNKHNTAISNDDNKYSNAPNNKNNKYNIMQNNNGGNNSINIKE